MIHKLWKDTWRILNTDIEIPWSEVVQGGVDSSKNVFDLAKALNENRSANELAPLIGRVSSLLDVLNSPLGQVAGAALPFIPIGTGLLKFIAAQTHKEPTLEISVALVSQAAYLEGLRAFLRKPENQGLVEHLQNTPASDKVAQNIQKLSEGLLLGDARLEMDEKEAEKALVSFHHSKLADAFNPLLAERLRDAGLKISQAEIVTERVSRSTHRYMKRSFAEAKETLRNLSGLYGDGWIEDLKIYQSIDNYLEEKIAKQPLEKVFAEKFSFQDIYTPLKAKAMGADGAVLENTPSFWLEKWVLTQLQQSDQQDQVMFVQAGPGRGKSVFCRMFGDWVRQYLYPIWIPVLIRLRDIKSFEKNFEKTLQAAIGREFSTPKDWLTDQNTRFLFLLDGFDELLMEGRTSSGLEHFLKQVGGFQESCKGNSERGHRVLITGRPLALQSIGRLLPPNLHHVMIQAFDDQQQQQWLTQWSRLVKTGESDQFHSFLKNQKCPKEVNELSREPLLMYLLAAMHRDQHLQVRMFEATNPTHAKILIYQESIDWVLTKQRPEWLNYDLTDVATQGLKRILIEAGLCVTQFGGEAAPIAMIEKRLEEDEEALNLITNARKRLGEDALRNALAAFYIKPGQGQDGSVEFIHKSFSEFLCAMRLKQSLDEWSQAGLSGRGFAVKPKQFEWEVYDLFGFGTLSIEIATYLIALIENSDDQRLEALFVRLVDFYDRWSGGEFIDLLTETTRPQQKGKQLSNHGISLGQRQVDVFVGLNILIVILELQRYSKTTNTINTLSFHPCGPPYSQIFDSEKLLATISYSQCIGINEFRAVLGPFLSEADLSNTDLNCANLRGVNLRGTNLFEANLRGAYLSDSDLCNANLGEADLSGADLSGIELCNAKLNGVDLTGAYLIGADLSNADLSGANLSGANLREACLISADLISAVLSDANLRGADLSDANLMRADLKDADLSNADLSNADLTHKQIGMAILCQTKLPENIDINPDRDCVNH